MMQWACRKYGTGCIFFELIPWHTGCYEWHTPLLYSTRLNFTTVSLLQNKLTSYTPSTVDLAH